MRVLGARPCESRDHGRVGVFLVEAPPLARPLDLVSMRVLDEALAVVGGHQFIVLVAEVNVWGALGEMPPDETAPGATPENHGVRMHPAVRADREGGEEAVGTPKKDVVPDAANDCPQLRKSEKHLANPAISRNMTPHEGKTPRFDSVFGEASFHPFDNLPIRPCIDAVVACGTEPPSTFVPTGVDVADAVAGEQCFRTTM